MPFLPCTSDNCLIRTAEEVKQEKQKKKRAKKRSANEAFVDEGNTKPQKLEDGMTLVSDLAETPGFLVGLAGGESTVSTLSPTLLYYHIV